MKEVYCYHPITKVFTEPTRAEQSPLEPNVFLIPAHATESKPPKPKSGHEVYFDGMAWKQRKIVVPVEPEPEPPTTQELARHARSKRNGLLNVSDWIRLRADDHGEAVPVEWLDYRQALRDVPQQPNFPNEIVWPQKP